MVRELFVMARAHAPSIIFMDEIDSIGPETLNAILQPKFLGGARTKGKGDSEVQRTMLELLNQLDGFEPTQNIKVAFSDGRIARIRSNLLGPHVYQPHRHPGSCSASSGTH
jgi:26S proteasome regulatory subunit T6